MIIKNRALVSACILGMFTSAANAHDIYIWPDYFTVNSDKATTVPVDITASHTTYRSDFSMPSEGVKIWAVDGSEMRQRGAFYEGSRRSTFDLPIDGEGTIKLEYWRGPSYRSSYTIGKRDTVKRVRGNKKELMAQLPEGAKNPETVRYMTIAMSYVTNKAPTQDVLSPKNKGVELIPITHPSDFVTGDELSVRLLLDGQPIPDQEVTLELEGPQYYQNPVALELKSDSEGNVNFTLEQGGRYMMKVIHSQASQDDEADIDRTRIYFAFEVIYE